MKNALYILIADYVPVANKGEEAIIRGIEDLLHDGRCIKIGLFDNVDAPVTTGNITAFPRHWLFQAEGAAFSGLVSRPRQLLTEMRLSVLMLFGYYSKLRNLFISSDASPGPLQKFVEKAEYVLVGHDGVFGVESCGVIMLCRKFGKVVGILGAGVGGRWYRRIYQNPVYSKAIPQSSFCIFRERSSFEYIRDLCGDRCDPILAPDPAFAMRPAEAGAVREVLEKHSSYKLASQKGRPIVTATVLERGIVYSFFEPDNPQADKPTAHAEYLACIFDTLIRQRNAFILFLPHSIEKEHSDVEAAHRVTAVMNSAPENYLIIEDDLSPRLLKGIIRESDFLVGQRAHSLIGAVSTATGFAGLTNRRDRRMYEILGEMCRCSDQILDMNALDAQGAAEKILELFDSRSEIEVHLQSVATGLDRQLEDVVKLVRSVAGRKD